MERRADLTKWTTFRHLAICTLAASLVTSVAEAGFVADCEAVLGLGVANEARALAYQADGKIVVAGYVDFGGGRDFLVARFHPDLSLDTSFGTGGWADIDVSLGLNDEAFDVAVQFDGKIVAVGYANSGGPSGNDFALVRVLPNGTPDPTFKINPPDPDGVIITDAASFDDQLRAVAIQPDGKIVVAGYYTPGPPRVAVARYNKNGTLDNATFALPSATPGIAKPVLGTSFSDQATDLVLQPDGKIVVSATALFASNDFAVLRLLPDGNLDPTFNVSNMGWVSTDLQAPAGRADVAEAVALQPDGNTVVAGSSNLGNNDIAVARYLGSGAGAGTLDVNFAPAVGYVVTNFVGASNDSGAAVAIETGGDIIVAGATDNPTPGPNQFLLARYRSNGMLDPGFGMAGIVSKNVTGLAADQAFALAITPELKLLAVGMSGGPAAPKTTLEQFRPDGSQECGQFFLNPIADDTTSFAPVGCAQNWDCVNDDPTNDPIDGPVLDDGLTTFVRSATTPNSDLYALTSSGAMPAGDVVTEVQIVARIAWDDTGTTAKAKLTYDRGAGSVQGNEKSVSSGGSTFETINEVWSDLNWPQTELDNLRIGIEHTDGDGLLVSQLYLRVMHGPPPIEEVDAFTATATAGSSTGEVLLNWLNPSYGLYHETTITRRTVDCPTDPNEVGDTSIMTQDDGRGGKGSFSDTTVATDTSYFYSAFVLDQEGHFSPHKCVEIVPRNVADNVEWTYDTVDNGVLLTTPGVHVDLPGNDSVGFTVDLNGTVHAFTTGTFASGGGGWPANWYPYRIGGVVQQRVTVVPPVAPLTDPIVLMSAQDGHVYAIDADSGALVWKSPKLGGMLQGTPAAALQQYGAPRDLAYVGTRDSAVANTLYALNLSDGTVLWSFDNGRMPDGIGIINGGVAVDYSGKLYFTSYPSATNNLSVWCLDLEFGTPCPGWPPGGGKALRNNGIDGSITIYNGALHITESPGLLFTLNPADGSEIHADINVGGEAVGFVFPFVNQPQLFLSNGTIVLSIDPAVGSPAWFCGMTTPSTPLHIPFTNDVYVGAGDSLLYRFDADDASTCNFPEMTQICVGDCVNNDTTVGSPAYDIRTNLIFVGTNEGSVFAIKPQF